MTTDGAFEIANKWLQIAGLRIKGAAEGCVRKVKGGSDRSMGSQFVSRNGVCKNTLTISELHDSVAVTCSRRLVLEPQSLPYLVLPVVV